MKPLLSRLICAVAALRDATVDDLATRSGLSVSRVSRLRSGAQVDEADARHVLRSLGVDPDSLIKQLNASDSECSKDCADAVAATLLALQSDATEAAHMVGTVRCDRLALLVPAGAATRCENFLKKALRRGKPVRTGSYRNAANYHGVFVAVGMPWKSRSSTGVRLEFNPAKLSIRGRSVVRRFVSAIRGKERVRISRVDVAVDLAIPSGWFQVIGTRTRKVTTVVGHHQLESLYIGSKTANLSFAIYDKRQERLDKGAAAGDAPLTRIEARFKNRSWTAADISDLPDPFATLKLLWLTGANLDFPDRVLTRLARVAGWPLLRRELSYEHYRRLEDHYARNALATDLLHPSVVFKSNWPRESRRVLVSLGLLP